MTYNELVQINGVCAILSDTEYNLTRKGGILLLNTNRQPAPLRLLSWLGQCGCDVLMLFPRCFAAAGRGILHFLRDLRHGCGRVLRLIGGILLKPFRLRLAVAHSAESQLRQGRKSDSRGAKVCAVLRMLGTVLFSEHGIVVSLFRFAVPLVCCGFLWSVVRYGKSIDYGIEVSFNGAAIGIISEEEDYELAEQIVRRRLSYTDEDIAFSFRREFRLTEDTETPRLLPGDLADRMLRSAAIELTDGWGVSRGDTFLGAVSDIKPIETALQEQLSRYQESLSFDADEVFYPEEITYEKGVFLKSNLTEPERIAAELTKVSYGTRTYTAAAGESVYSAAMRFSTTPEHLRELNPDLPDSIPIATRITVPTEERALPISYRRTLRLTAFVDYDVIRTETNRLNAGTEKVLRRGIKGERSNTVQITYTDGEESGRELLDSQILSLPVDEELGIGTYAPQPFSKETQFNGTGQFAWPLNGGYISDVFISNRTHRGIDIAAPGGTEIYAAEDGVVTTATLSGSYGNYVKLDHGDGYETLYAHCSLLLVEPGQEVTRGQVIALVGTTGHSTGNHLHFEVRRDGLNFNPADYLRVNVD